MLTTQIIAHDKAVYDVSFAPNDYMFASCGEDGSVRIFDTNDLKQSSIIYENRDTALIKVQWNARDSNLISLLPTESRSVLLLDIRKANEPVGKLEHDEICNSFTWNASSDSQILTAQDGCKALIWNVKETEKNGVSSVKNRCEAGL